MRDAGHGALRTNNHGIGNPKTSSGVTCRLMKNSVFPGMPSGLLDMKGLLEARAAANAAALHSWVPSRSMIHLAFRQHDSIFCPVPHYTGVLVSSSCWLSALSCFFCNEILDTPASVMSLVRLVMMVMMRIMVVMVMMITMAVMMTRPGLFSHISLSWYPYYKQRSRMVPLYDFEHLETQLDYR